MISDKQIKNYLVFRLLMDSGLLNININQIFKNFQYF